MHELQEALDVSNLPNQQQPTTTAAAASGDNNNNNINVNYYRCTHDDGDCIYLAVKRNTARGGN
jgi:hypothetical protein